MQEIKVLAIHGCCRGDDPPDKVIAEVERSTKASLKTAGFDATVVAPFYGAILNAYARADFSAFPASGGLESAEEPGNVDKAALESAYASISDEMTAKDGLEMRLPIPAVVREMIIHSFTTDVATYLTMLRAKKALWKIVTDAWKSLGAEGPDLVIAHSLGSLVVWDVIVGFGEDLRGPTGLLMMGSPLYLGEVKRGMSSAPHTRLRVDKWIHVYDDGDLIAGGKPLAPAYGGVVDIMVENKSFPTSHSYPAYVQAAAELGLVADLVG